MKRYKSRARISLPLVIASALVVILCFLVAARTTTATNGAQIGAELPTVTEQDTASTLPEAIPPAIERDKPEMYYDEVTDPDFTGYPEIVHYIPDEAEVEMLARVLWGEARGIPSDMEKAAVVWCVLNRVDAEEWPDTVAEVVTQRFQFMGYSPDFPATDELKAIAADVLIRWEREKREGGDVGRVLPEEYTFFTGDGRNNHFRNAYSGGDFWDWTLTNPYES